ncbi:MAG: HAMP domain-containing histidine kinase [Peptococcaceae bacterium]|nr:HAMP domain-containing histidine kinase [Peptococcaceae bacterium]
MSFFRNKDIRHAAALLFLMCAAFTTAGFMASLLTGVFVLAVCAALCTVFFLFTRKRYHVLTRLSEQIDLILHGNDEFSVDTYTEGEVSILQSEIQKMTVRLREQADTLKKDKRYLSESLADIAHQLRTPLTSIHMLVSFLAKPDLNPEQRAEFVRDLENLLSRIDWLLSSLLKISKIDAGTAVFQQKKIPLCALLSRTVEPLEIPLEIRNIDLRIDCEEDLCITGDLNWTAEAVSNILKNCMEHTDEGGVIGITCTANTIFTELVIQDSGSGIAPEDLPHIFERFYQNPCHKVRHKDSSFGVGLALCRMILSAQNATVKASNRPEGGARFTVRFYHQNEQHASFDRGCS